MAELKAGDTCPQCKNGKMHYVETVKKGSGFYEVLSCVKCGWKYRRETPNS